MREANPPNLESPFEALDGFAVPTERFFVRSHFPVPEADLGSWRLAVEGPGVDRPFGLGWDELALLPTVTRAVTFECAGNGRLHLEPPTKGLQWASGAVGNALWTGVPLAPLLERAGLRDDAVEVVFEGADAGPHLEEGPKPAGVQTYARGLPAAKARRPEVLLATAMNGAPLRPEHGYPLRLVVPGWYGMASVKWLRRVLVLRRPFDGFYQTAHYAVWERREGGLAVRVPVGEMEVKAAVARPAPHEAVRAGAPYRIHGAAWSGEADVAAVEVSTDGGRAWGPARLLDEPVPYAWRLWEFEWRAPAPGRHVVMARATDTRGRTQPGARDPDRESYMVSHILPVPVEAR